MKDFRKRFLTLCSALTLLGISSSSLATTHTFSTPTLIACADNSFDGDSIVVNGTTLTIECAHSFAYLRVTANGIATHPAGDVNGLQLTVTGDLLVEAGSSIDVNGRGYAQNTGPGTPAFSGDGAGAGHGGLGGASGPLVTGMPGGSFYDLIENPAQPGSGGGGGNSGGGGAGGGLIRINVSGVLTNNGEIKSNGANGTAPNYAGGGGAGGGIKLSCATLSGNGIIRASGGNGGSWGGNGGGGGSGGRVAISYTASSFSGQIVACGGIGWQDVQAFNGGAGSIYLLDSSLGESRLIVDNCNVDGNYFVFYTAPAQPSITEFVARNRASVRADGWSNPSRSVKVQTNAKIVPAVLQSLYINADSVIVEANSSLSAKGFGYAMNSGPTPGSSNTDGGGGGHGGWGGDAGAGLFVGGATSGDMFAPTEFGSGGGGGNNSAGGSGGGAVRVIASSLFRNDGVVTASGNDGFVPNYSGGGGAGGSIWITTVALEGSGVISANGGVGPQWQFGGNGGSGGGGGGRILLDFVSLAYTGDVTACGGNGWNGTASTHGGAGTILMSDLNINEIDLIVGNCGETGRLTEIDPQGFIFDSISIKDEAQLYSSTLLRGNNMHISTGADLVTVPLVGLELFANDNLTIDAGCTISADGKGYAGGQGPGVGQSINDAGGGGHGGAGGDGCGGTIGGIANGDSCEGESFGSGGGQGLNNGAGAGGGFIKLNANVIDISGDISANGANGFAPNWSGGGGAGGAIRIYASTIQGSGFISAHGGNGGSWGGCGSGGGGGGRVAFLSTVLSYPLGNVDVNGGLGGPGASQPGQIGTICQAPFSDCNHNGISDVLEITLNPSLDQCPMNGVIDECDGFTAPVVTIYDNAGVVMLQWNCVYSATSYDVYSRLLNGTYQFLANTVNTQLDVTSLIEPGNYDKREFYVIANGGD